MREYKFRAWDKSFNKMRYWDNIQKQCNWNIFKVDNEVFEVMQYTGLKDKNGKEIYEGDIYLCSWGSHNIVKYRIKNKREITGHGMSDIFIKAGFNIDFADGGIEIIGNIHDNPELLKAVVNDTD